MNPSHACYAIPQLPSAPLVARAGNGHQAVPSSEDCERDVPNQLRCLAEDVATLDNLVRELVSRLGPLIKPEAGPRGSGGDAPRPLFSPIAEQLLGFRDNIRENQDRIRFLLDAVQV